MAPNARLVIAEFRRGNSRKLLELLFEKPILGGYVLARREAAERCLMSNMIKWTGLAAIALACFGGAMSQAETVVLRSGNGSIGGNDTLISMLDWAGRHKLRRGLHAGRFFSRRQRAGCLHHCESWQLGWLRCPSDPLARWISTSANGAE